MLKIKLFLSSSFNYEKTEKYDNKLVFSSSMV